MPTIETTRFHELLRKRGYRITNARELTFSLLMTPDPQSMREIILRAGNRADRVSIYRSVELFEQLGIVHRIYVGWKYKLELSDEFVAHHHHLSCLKCGRIIDIADEQHIDTFIANISKQHSFTPTRHQFEIEGYCKQCAAKAN